MKVFISWSGDESKRIAEIIQNWLKSVIQSTDPWISKDIEKGSRWDSEIADKLKKSSVGIICLTPNNLDSNWLLFEAGAISSNENSKVCTLLWNLKTSDIKPPLDRFQHTELNKKDMLNLLKTINLQLGENKLSTEVLESTFNVWWPELEEKLNSIVFSKKQGELREERDLIEEILDNTRQIQNTLRILNKSERSRIDKYENFNLDPISVNSKPKFIRQKINTEKEYPTIICPKCGSKDIILWNIYSIEGESTNHLYECSNCGFCFQINNEKNSKLF